jgi:DnaA family protein
MWTVLMRRNSTCGLQLVCPCHARLPTASVRWVLAAGRLPTADLLLREDLRTRLGWGQVFALQLLSDAEVKLALQQAARHRGLALGDDVVAYMQKRFARDTGSLMALATNA